MSQENVETIRKIYGAFSTGDVPAALGMMDEAIEWREAENFLYADRNPYIGPQAVLVGVFMRLGSEWENFAVHAEEIFDAGDTVISTGRYTGKFNQTGKDVDAQFVHVWRILDGKAVGFQQYTDTKQFAGAAAA